MEEKSIDERLLEIESKLDKLEALEKQQNEMLEHLIKIHTCVKKMDDNSLHDNIMGNFMYGIMFGR